jgi:DNA-binding CsgD family transcriptional regulator
MHNGRDPKSNAKRSMRKLAASLYARIGTLTRTERAVLEWVEKGKRNAEVAQILGSSERTIESHVSAILAKLGVETRGAAASTWREVQSNGGAQLPAAKARGRRVKG